MTDLAWPTFWRRSCELLIFFRGSGLSVSKWRREVGLSLVFDWGCLNVGRYTLGTAWFLGFLSFVGRILQRRQLKVGVILGAPLRNSPYHASGN